MSKLNFFGTERFGKTILYMLVDACIVDLSLIIALSLWYDGTIPGNKSTIYLGIPPEAWDIFQLMAIISPIICIIVYTVFRIYNNLWKYASIDEIFKIFIATIVAFFIIYSIDYFILNDINTMYLTRRMFFTAWILEFILFTFTRFGYRAIKRSFIFIGHMMSSKSGCRRVMVVGAGFSGYGVIRGMLNSKIRDRIPIIVVDSDLSKNNTHILGIRVISGIDKIQELSAKYQIDDIIIAKTQASDEELQEIIKQCTLTECNIKIMPPISDISDEKNITSKVRDLNITDLLFREEVTLDTKNIKEYLSNRTILVTGGGGSIGSELCRQISKFEPQLLIIFDIYENNAYMLMNELKARYKDKINVIIRIGSVRDIGRLEEVFDEFKPNVIFHAAAHKHVPLMEDSPAEAVKNNVFGAYNVVKCASKFKAERFVILSTDKAVNPTNVMGATKRITEIIIQNMARKSDTKFMAVRFGNVLGSNGSIIPLFQQQIASGGPVTVTHPDIERYFMTIPEAAQLVLQAASLGKTGRVFVLDMGSPVKIAELAKNIIKLSGFRPNKDIEIKYTGLRPGEKLYEELILDEEKDQMQITCHKKIFMTKPIDLDYNKFEKLLEELRIAATSHHEKIEECLQKLVPTYCNSKNNDSNKSIEEEHEFIDDKEEVLQKDNIIMKKRNVS